jgi:hypothetical protein
LEALGLIVRHSVIDPKTAQQRPTRYYMAFEDGFETRRRALLSGVDKSAFHVQDLHTGPCAKTAKSRVQNLHTKEVKKDFCNTRAPARGAGPVDKPLWPGDPALRHAIANHPQYGLGFVENYLDRATVPVAGRIITRTHIAADRLRACLQVLGVQGFDVTGPPGPGA